MNKTDAEIVKILEYCEGDDGISYCHQCPLYEMDNCVHFMSRKAREIINRLKAENERLQAVADAELDTIHDIGEDYERVLEEEPILIQKAKAEAVTEFAERLKMKVTLDLCEAIDCSDYLYDLPKLIDNLVKEMTE